MTSSLPAHRQTAAPSPPRRVGAARRGVVVGFVIAGVVAVLLLCGPPAFGAWVYFFLGPDLDDARAAADTYLSRIEQGNDAAAYGQICASVRREIPQAAFTEAVENAPRPRSHVIVDVVGQGESHSTATVKSRTTDATGGQRDVSFKVALDDGVWQVCDRSFI